MISLLSNCEAYFFNRYNNSKSPIFFSLILVQAITSLRLNLIDKIIDWLDAFGKFKKRINTWYYLKDTQIAFAIILFLIIIFTVFYAMSKSNFNWYLSRPDR
eukprot:TRINITY_DN1178_c0_g1_i1.p1 TRINITY_DN1178_c0_g1~~TRINITY_DN1178_c0_g1_i1.p1  ORF type:complete len:102 (-),score=1.87 TRINITY_DN1178_c0_g1_i1:992-1297(-)